MVCGKSFAFSRITSLPDWCILLQYPIDMEKVILYLKTANVKKTVFLQLSGFSARESLQTDAISILVDYACILPYPHPLAIISPSFPDSSIDLPSSTPIILSFQSEKIVVLSSKSLKITAVWRKMTITFVYLLYLIYGQVSSTKLKLNLLLIICHLDTLREIPIAEI